MTSIRTIEWKNIHEAPRAEGIYAWYYQPDVTTFDVNKVIADIKQCNANGEPEKALVIAEEFLLKRIFGYFKYEPYDVVLSGQLMPGFTGRVLNEQTVSKTFLTKIVSEPERLVPIQQYLKGAAPLFSSPLYIGKSDSLNMRLTTHKNLILKYRTMPTGALKDEDNEDTSFAKRVVAREIPPERLFVITYEITIGSNIHVDMEHIFNRISYPILGRN